MNRKDHEPRLVAAAVAGPLVVSLRSAEDTQITSISEDPFGACGEPASSRSP